MTALSYAGKGSLTFAFIKDTQQGLWDFSKNMFCLCIILSKNYIFTYSQVFLICLFLYKDAPVFYNITIHLSNSVVIIITFVPLPFFFWNRYWFCCNARVSCWFLLETLSSCGLKYLTSLCFHLLLSFATYASWLHSECFLIHSLVNCCSQKWNCQSKKCFSRKNLKLWWNSSRQYCSTNTAITFLSFCL